MNTIKEIAFASDHAGFAMKQKLKSYLETKGYTVKDFGTDSEASVDYPDFGHLLATAVENGEFRLGIALCGSGNGINITVNKHQGIRAALCWNEQIAFYARSHNDANICTIPARYISYEEAVAIVDKFLTTSFEGGRHAVRVEKIAVKA